MRWTNWFQSKLLHKMVLIYSLLILIPLSIISGTFYLRSKSIMENQTIETENRILEETSDKIDNVLRLIAKKTSEIADNPAIQKMLANDALPTQYPLRQNERDYIQDAAMEALEIAIANTKREAGDFTDSIHLYNRSGGHYIAGQGKAVQFYQAFKILPYDQPGTPQWVFFPDHRRMVCAAMIFDKETGLELGFVLFMLKIDHVMTLYENYPQNAFYITNANNIILSHHQSSRVGDLYTASKQQGLVTLTHKSQVSEFKYISEIRTDKLTASIRKQAYYAAGLTVVSWIIVVVITYLILKRITNPLLKLTRLMRSAERGKYELIKDIRTKDEIASLCLSFNSLVTETQDLIQRVYRTELLKKEAELKAIRMQFNPHFLYNTLEYISIMAQNGQAKEQIPIIVKKVADIFRFSISPGQTVIPLEMELEFASLYMQIHEFRFGDRFSYQTVLPDELKRVTVPKLILQPLVENAFVHGVDRVHGNGTIQIVAYEHEFQLVIEVRDNGGGLSGTEAALHKKGLGTGLENVRSRMLHHYGPSAQLELLQLEQGTCVRLTMPITLVEQTEAG
ncbi:sensor histidine kinase [Paenibacillus montanisoli]|nr:sensor histidine kinase [Paenibacillus montanisoli]